MTELYGIPTCRVCGCTDARACPGGCSWVEVDLCSRCREALDRNDLEKLGIADVGPWRGPTTEEWVRRIRQGSAPASELELAAMWGYL